MKNNYLRFFKAQLTSSETSSSIIIIFSAILLVNVRFTNLLNALAKKKISKYRKKKFFFVNFIGKRSFGSTL